MLLDRVKLRAANNHNYSNVFFKYPMMIEFEDLPTIQQYNNNASEKTFCFFIHLDKFRENE